MIIRSRIADLLTAPPPAAQGRPVTVWGWARSRRDSKAGISFIDLSDGSVLAGLQVVAPATLPNYGDLLKRVHTGTAVRVTGLLVPSQGRGQSVEIQADAIEVVGDVDPEAYPIQKQAMSLEHLRGLPHLRARTRTVQAIMGVRSVLAGAVHRFFQDRGFACVHTPIITGGDCEGAGRQFRVTTLDPAKPPRTAEGGVDWAQDFFAREVHLTVSGQLEGETYACGLGDIYTFGPTFRAENSNTPRHLAEFWMIEPEMAFCDLDGDRAVASDFVRATVADALNRCGPEIEFLEKQQAPGLRASLETLAGSDFAHLTYSEAITALERSGKRFEFPVRWGIDLQAEHERWLVEEHCKRPAVVTNYPKEIKAFYMRLDDDGRTVAAMDVLVPRMGELIGGSQREDRLDVLERRMREAGLDPAHYAGYLDLRRFGSVPHAGFGLGFERLVCLVTGTQNIRDVIPYPRTPGHCP
ncbi:MAG: asparagine--tRNA ligase [Planctomycetes bacterium]|nr:asparagine--tRNA ligase [Planctomycetota bacterium]